MKTQVALKDTDFIFLKVKNLWTHFKSESFAFKCICIYIFVEYFRPQAIIPFLDFLPWAQLFLILSFIGLFFDRNKSFKFYSSYYLTISFFLIINVSILTAWDPSISIEKYILFSQWVFIIFLIGAIVTTRERFYIFFLVFFMCCCKIALGTAKIWVMRGFSFTGWGLMGPPGYFQNSGELAVLMLILFPISYYIFNQLKSNVRKWEYYFLVLVTIAPILTILGSSSRGAQIALLMQLIVIFRKKVFKLKYIIFLSFILILGWKVLPEEQKLRFTEIGEDRTSNQRMLYWENGWEIMKENPFLGIGYFNFQSYYQVHYPEGMLYDKAQQPHNIFVQVGTDSGFTGLFLFILILINCLFMSFKPRKAMYKFSEENIFYFQIWKGLKIGIWGFVVAGQFVTIAYYPFLWISLALQISLKKSCEK